MCSRVVTGVCGAGKRVGADAQAHAPMRQVQDVDLCCFGVQFCVRLFKEGVFAGARLLVVS